MQSRNSFTRVLTLFLLLALSACSALKPAAEPTQISSGAVTDGSATTKTSEGFDPANFTESSRITNPWFPLEPGTQYTYEGTTVEDGESVPHKIVITVTDLTKVIGTVRSAVTWDRDYSDGVLVEAELAFFAQDKNGNVWRMGEYPEEYEENQFVAAPTWIHGYQNARAGIAMQANPQTGTPDYAQGWGPAVDWTDRGRVDQMGQKVCVPAQCYEDVLVIAETSESEPGAFQLKYYAPGVGNIKTDWTGTDETKEVLDLTEVVKLNADGLAEARAGAIALEKHAYEVSTEMYTKTSPVEYPVGTPAFHVEVAQAGNDQSPPNPSSGTAAEVVVYAADLSSSALFELRLMDDSASPGGKYISLPNEGDELDPPPEKDPRATFTVQVQKDTPYRCWIHMKVGAPKGKSTANVVWIQFSDAVNQANSPILTLGSESYLTATGPLQEGWHWVACDLAGTDSLIRFIADGEVTVRVQAGMEGVGFDQVVLSSERFLVEPPSSSIVEK